MQRLLLIAALLCPPSWAKAQTSTVSPLLAQSLPDLPGKEVVMATVTMAPGGSDPAHRHNAHVFVYVLEGAVIMQVEGGEEVTLTPRQTFYESPSDVHVVGKNASATEPAKFLVSFVKDIGAPVLVPAE